MSGSATLYEAVKSAAAIRLPGAPMETIDHEARWVLAEFLRETRVWRRAIDVVLVAGTAEYALPGLATTESVSVIMSAAIEGTDPIRIADVPEAALSDGVTGTPMVVGMIDDRNVRVYPVPTAEDAGKALVLDVALSLLISEDATPPDVLRPYQGYLLDGLLSRLYFMPDKPWSNARSAETHVRRFESGKAAVRRELDGGRTFGGVKMRIPRFGA